MRGRCGATRLYAFALRLLPRWFRREYGRDMVGAFEARYRRLREGTGRVAAARFLLSALLDVPPAALEARRYRSSAGAARGGASGWLDDLGQAVRSLRRAPGWTTTALVILALGIGGTTAVFSVLHAVLLRPLPFEEPHRLASVWTVNEAQDLPDGSSYENGRDWRDRARALEDVAFVLRPEFSTATVTSFGEPERIHVGLVSAGFFELLGVRAVVGRVFGASDLATGGGVAVIGASLWRDRYAGDPGVVGSSLTIDGGEVRIVGVVPDEVSIPLRETRVWELMDVRPPEDRSRRGWDAYWVIGRLADGATLESAQRELDVVADDLAVLHPETNRNRGVRIRSLRDEIVGERVPLTLWTLLGSMGLVLLVGGTNVAQLMLGRGIERRREMAVRASLGASRARIHRQLLLESGVLALAAGVGGLLIALAGLRTFLSFVPPDVPLIDRVRIDGVVLAAGFVAAGVLGPLIGFLPALGASRTHVADTLRTGGRGATGRERRARSALVVAEVAIAVVLLVGSGLLLRSVVALQAVDPGLDAQGTLIARVDLSRSGVGDPLLRPRAITEALRSHPAVEGVAVIGRFFVDRIPDQTIEIVGTPPRDPAEPRPRLTTDQVVPGFFEGLGVPLLRGRALGASDVAEGYGFSTVVVNRTWVETFAKGRDPVGLQFRWSDQPEEAAPITVVGVVGDLRRTALEETAYPQMFAAGAEAGFDLLVRVSGDPLDLVADVRRAVRETDAMAALSRVGSVWSRYDVGLAPRHFQTVMFALFAALATLLAAIGLFAVLHDAVAARRREIGIRIALGAEPARVRRMVFGSGLGLTALGLIVGLGATLVLTGLLDRLVYGVRSIDPVTLGIVTLAVLTVATIASLVPALTATRVSPSEALASE